MIETSSLYKTLFNAGAMQEYQIEIEGVMYDQNVIYDKTEISENLFATNTFTVGSFTVSSLKVKLWLENHEIPRNAEIKFYYRYVNDVEQSEWILKFAGNVVDRTRYTDEITTIEAYSKAANYDVFLNHFGSAISSYPANARTVANLCATHLGLTIENIEDIYDGDIVEYPNELTMVQVLQNIAKSSGGNWAIIGENNLRLVVLGNTNPILEYRTQTVAQSELLSPISMVRAYWKDDSAFEVGDDSGSVLEIDNPWATQTNTAYLLGILGGYEYVPVKGQGAYADPALQLGDTFKYSNGVKQTVAKVKWTFDGITTADIETPQENEISYDNPYDILAQQEFKKKVTLGESYQGVSIGRETGIQMLLSPDGTEENATGRWYADLNKGMAFQTRNSPSEDWHDWMYFDKNEKRFKLSLYSTTTEVDDKVKDATKDLTDKVAEIDVDISSIRLEVSQMGGYNIISNPIGRFGVLDWTFESPHIKAYAVAPFNKAYTNAPYLKAQNDNGSIMVGVETDTQAKYGFRVWKSGKALSKITIAESGSDYSLHTKVKGTGVLRFKLREYTSATPTSKSSFFKETLLNTTNPTTNYSTYEKTVTLDNTTQSVVLVVESDVSSRNGQFALFTNTSFNIGQPKPYGESITDMNNRIDSVNARVTIAEDTVDLFTSRVDTVEGQVNTNTSQLTVQAGEISSKVDKNGVISAINQTAESVKIYASKINLDGYVTISSLAGSGTTTIDGSNIKTGTISANRINFNGATGTNVNLTGTITATSGSVGGFQIGTTLSGQTSWTTKTMTMADYDRVGQIVTKEIVATQSDYDNYDINKDGKISSEDYALIGRMINGTDPNPQTFTYVTTLNTADPYSAIMVTANKPYINPTQIGAGRVKSEGGDFKSVYAQNIYLQGIRLLIDSNGFVRALN